MPYPTQHENFYKNRIVQLQQKLQQLTEMYEYRLNEAMPPIPPIHIPPTHIPHIPHIPDVQLGTVRPRGSMSALELAMAAAARLAEFAARLAEFVNKSPAEILDMINNGGLEFAKYVSEHYGIIVRVGSSYQRLSPDGTVQVWGTNGTWNNINKPGTLTSFGYISANGVVIPMDVYRQMGHGGISPADINYSTRPNSGTADYGTPYENPRDAHPWIPYTPGS